MNLKNRTALILSAVACFSIAACGEDSDDNKGQTISELAVATPELTTLVAALQKAALVDTLSGPGPFTVFAPTNAAFDALKSAGIDATQLDVPTLTAVLKLHVAAGDASAAAVSASTSQTTLSGAVKVSSRDGGVYLNGLTKIVTTDIKASNGTIHLIDSVLLPDTGLLDFVGIAKAYPALSSLRDAVVAANLATALSGEATLTLFAPTNAAFAKLAAAPSATDLPKILQYHVLASEVGATAAIAVAQKAAPQNQAPTLLTDKSVTLTLAGQTLKINDSAVTYADIPSKSGVIHLIDTVLIPQ